MGRNTRALFRGVKTIRGYHSRYAKVFQDEASQSNGFLIRATHLALHPGTQHIVADVNLTNPDPLCREVCKSYVAGLRSGWLGHSKTTTAQTMFHATRDPQVRDLIRNRGNRRTLSPTPRYPKAGKGWCLHAFWCASHCLSKCLSFTDTMQFVIADNPRSDTDTNAAITGGLLGAHLGYRRMMREPLVARNLEILMNTPTDRPEAYRPFDLAQLASDATKIFRQ